MGKKVYFFIVLLVTLFFYYYQFTITYNFSLIAIASFIRDIIVIVGGFSLYFKKDLFEIKRWQLIYKFLIGITIVTFVYQILPTSYFGNASVGNASLLTNIFVYLLLLTFYLPLYLAVYRLSKK